MSRMAAQPPLSALTDPCASGHATKRERTNPSLLPPVEYPQSSTPSRDPWRGLPPVATHRQQSSCPAHVGSRPLLRPAREAGRGAAGGGGGGVLRCCHKRRRPTRPCVLRPPHGPGHAEGTRCAGRGGDAARPGLHITAQPQRCFRRTGSSAPRSAAGCRTAPKKSVRHRRRARAACCTAPCSQLQHRSKRHRSERQHRENVC